MTRDQARALLVKQGANLMKATEKGAAGALAFREAEAEFHRARKLLDAAADAICQFDADEQLQCLRESAELIDAVDSEVYKMYVQNIVAARLSPDEARLITQLGNAPMN